MVQGPIKSLSLEAFLQLPETGPDSEYIDGQVLQKPMPQGKHSRLQKRLIYKIESVVQSEAIAEAFPELRCTLGRRSVVPDVVVLKQETIPADDSGEIANAVLRAPDWTIEILSPNQDYKKSRGTFCIVSITVMRWVGYWTRKRKPFLLRLRMGDRETSIKLMLYSPFLAGPQL